MSEGKEGSSWGKRIKARFDRQKTTESAPINPQAKKLTPEEQVREDLVREVIRKVERENRPAIEEAQRQAVEEHAAAEAQALNALSNLSSAAQELNPRPIPKEKLDAAKQHMADIHARHERERQERLTSTRAKVEQLRQENDDAEGIHTDKTSSSN